MITRATYIFKDEKRSVGVFIDRYNSPSQAIAYIRNAVKNPWELPRFKADEFAANFIDANNKKDRDDHYVGNMGNNEDFIYEISIKNDELYIECFKTHRFIKTHLFSGNVDQFERFCINNNC